jgi:hypothetical protein
MATLSGRWTIRAIGKEAGWDQGIQITGSTSNDGIYSLNVGDVISDVDGVDMTLTAKYLDGNTGSWNDSLQQDTWTWDDSLGMTLTIYADDNPPAGDLDFNDLVVVCEPQDPELISPHAGFTRPDLRIPESKVKWEWLEPNE